MKLASNEFIASLRHSYLVGYDVADDGTLVVIFFDDDLNDPSDLAERDFAHALLALGEAFKKDPPSFANPVSMRVAMAREQWKQSSQVDLRLCTEREGRTFKGLSLLIGSEPTH